MTRAPWIASFATVLLLATLVGTGAALAQDSRDVEARDLFVAGKYSQALEIYQDLYTRSRHPTYLRNMGRCRQMLRQPDPAISHFRAYLREARDLTAQERAEVEGYIAEMQGLRAVQASASPPTGPRPAAGTVTATSSPGESAAVTRKWWFWTGLGALVAGGVITAIALSGHKGNRPPCPTDTLCPP
jgi:tetratricopeptide (TPR) repeat protein